MKLIITTPDFFQANPKKLAIDEQPNTGRIYFLKGGRIVAVAEPTGAQDHAAA